MPLLLTTIYPRLHVNKIQTNKYNIKYIKTNDDFYVYNVGHGKPISVVYIKIIMYYINYIIINRKL